MDAPDFLFVAGDGLGREDDEIAGLERNMRMLVLGDARNGSTWLALATGAEQHDLVRGQIAELFLVEEFAGTRKITAGSCRFDGVPHGTAGDHHLAARGARRLHGRGYAVDMGGEGGDRDAAL